MSAKDIFHNMVRSALEKDGWAITHEPLFLKPSQRAKIKIDLGAQKLLSAQKGTQKIAVEVKSFVGLSAISEFHTAVGQFINYRVALKKTGSRTSFVFSRPHRYLSKFLYRFVRSRGD